MKKLSVTKLVLLASVSPAALVFAGAANAADLPLKAAMAAPVPAYSWTGCYAGAHVGWGWGQQRPTDGFFGSSSGGRSAKGSLDTSGGLFGGQVGCNYQFAGNWVVGLQGDLAGTDINGKGRDPLFGFKGATVALKTDWLASVTGRVGLTSSDHLALYYAKGGVAWDHNQWDLSNLALLRPQHLVRNPHRMDHRRRRRMGALVAEVDGVCRVQLLQFRQWAYHLRRGRRFFPDGTAVYRDRQGRDKLQAKRSVKAHSCFC